MGLRPMPHLGSFFGKKLPKDPKKPNCIGFRLSSIDSKQGCRRQPCFLFGENFSYSFSYEVKKLKVCSFKKQQRNKTKQARLSSLLLLSMGAVFFTFARETSIVSINHAKVNSSYLSGLEHSLCSYTRSNRRGGEVRFPREERRAAPSSPFLDRFGDV